MDRLLVHPGGYPEESMGNSGSIQKDDDAGRNARSLPSARRALLRTIRASLRARSLAALRERRRNGRVEEPNEAAS